MTPYRDINDEEWQRVAPLLPELRPRADLRGRPLANTRSVLNGVLWVMYSGATWSSLPRKYPSYQTCHRRFKVWYDSGVLRRVMDQLFGQSASDELCTIMYMRMRGHFGDKRQAPAGGRHTGVATPGISTPGTNYRGASGQPTGLASFSYGKSLERTQ